MGFDGRVGQLLNSNGDPCGTAWLISPHHALTASHCVPPGDPRYTIRFDSGDVSMRLMDRSHDISADLDLAILTVDEDASQPDIYSLAVPISSQMPKRSDRVNLLGFPFSADGEVITGTNLSGSVASINTRIKGCPVDVIQLADVPNSTDELRGISGGIAWLENLGGRDLAIGVVFHGGKHSGVHLMPLCEAARWHRAIADALDDSGDRRPGCLVIDALDDGTLDWNGPIQPDAVDELWGGASPVKSILCRVAKSDLGPALNQALLRMVAHGPDIQIESAVTDWPTAIDGLWLDTPVKVTTTEVRHRTKAAGTAMDRDSLAESMHGALDRFMLKQLNEDVCKQCTDRHRDRVTLDVSLRTRMQEIWEYSWHPKLERNPVLLRMMLLRLATHDEANISPLDLSKVGPKLDRSVLWRPIVYALAIAASGVAIVPATPERGNFVMGDGREGHVSGCPQIDREDLVFCVCKAQLWTVWIVILARLEERYSYLLGRSVSMREGKAHYPALTDPGLPPLLLSGSSDFKQALQAGATEVRAYLSHEKNAIKQHVDAKYGETEAKEWMSRFVF